MNQKIIERFRKRFLTGEAEMFRKLVPVIWAKGIEIEQFIIEEFEKQKKEIEQKCSDGCDKFVEFIKKEMKKALCEEIEKLNRNKKEIAGSGTFDKEGNDHFLNGFNQAIQDILNIINK